MLRNFLNLEEPQGPIRWPREIAALLAVLSALLIYFQYTTLDKFSVLPPARRYPNLPTFIQVVKQNVPLDTGDAVAAGLILAACAPPSLSWSSGRNVFPHFCAKFLKPRRGHCSRWA